MRLRRPETRGRLEGAPEASREESPSEGSKERGRPVREFGRYEILEEVSHGAMGIVYRAREKPLGRIVALKVLLAGEHASGEQVGRFIREAKAIARLRHPNIVPIHDVGEVDGRHYFTMDYVEGRTLAELASDGAIEPRAALDIIEAVADAVGAAHDAGVIHRDIKPSNIMLDSGGRALIMDFGLAKPVDEGTKYTRTGTTIGTPAYMPPEQARGEIDRVSAASDVYSIGAVLYELVTGVAPFDGPNMLDVILNVIHDEPLPPRRRNPRIHADVQTIILRAMEKDPARRYTSAAELRDDIRRFKAGEAIRARPPSVLRHFARWLGRHKVEVTAAAAVATIAAGSVLFVVDVSRRMEESRKLAEQERMELEKRIEQGATYDRPAWSLIWEDAAPSTGEQGNWREQACFIDGREMAPRVRDGVLEADAGIQAPFLGDVRVTGEIETTSDAKGPALVCGLVSTQDPKAPVPFYGVCGGGRVRLHAVPDIEQSASERRTLRDLAAMAERETAELRAGARYQFLLERRGMEITFQVAGPDTDETLTLKNLGFSNWRAKNVLPVLGLREGVRFRSFRIDQLVSGRMDAFETADGLFLRGEYNGAQARYSAIVDTGRPAHRVNDARLRLGECAEIKRQFDEALRWYRSVEEDPGSPETFVKAKLREPFCLLALGRADGAAEAVLSLADRAGRSDAPEWDVDRSPWVWSLAGLAEGLVRAKKRHVAAELVTLARPARGWTRMEALAREAGMGLASAGRTGDLLALAEAAPSADLAPVFAKAVASLSGDDPEEALSMLIQAAKRFPGRAEELDGAAAALALRLVEKGDFTGPVRVHRVHPRQPVAATFKDAVGAAVAKGEYDESLAVLAYANGQNPEHDDVLRGLATALAKSLCSEGRFGEVRAVYEAYPDKSLAAGFREAAEGLIEGGETDEALSLLDFARRNFGPDDEKLAAAAASLSQRLASTRRVEDAVTVRRAVEAYPGRAHSRPVREAMTTLASSGRPVDAMSLFASLRARQPRGDSALASHALGILEEMEDPVEREQGFEALSRLEARFRYDAEARARWLVELGDMAARVGGRPRRAETLYREAADLRRATPAALVAWGRLAVLLDAEGRRREADYAWELLANLEEAPSGLVQAATFVLGRTGGDSFAKWRLENGKAMSSAEYDLYLGLRALRDHKMDEAKDAFRRSRRAVRGRKWPYHVLERLGS
jgi:tetratricopeptide (TPR) repeat protein/predicted Ser/Thr protein kinase